MQSELGLSVYSALPTVKHWGWLSWVAVSQNFHLPIRTLAEVALTIAGKNWFGNFDLAIESCVSMSLFYCPCAACAAQSGYCFFSSSWVPVSHADNHVTSVFKKEKVHGLVEFMEVFEALRLNSGPHVPHLLLLWVVLKWSSSGAIGERIVVTWMVQRMISCNLFKTPLLPSLYTIRFN